MHVTHAVDSAQGSNAVRGGNREFKTLLRGDDNSPGNYKLSFVRQSGELYVPLPGEDLQKLVREVADLAPDLAAKAKAAYLTVK